MNACKHIRNIACKSLDAGESTPPATAREHLETCPDCRAWWEQIREVEALFRESKAAAPAAPAALRGRIRAALDRESNPSRTRPDFPVSRWLAIAATFVLAAGILALLAALRSRDSGASAAVARNTGEESRSPAPPSAVAMPSMAALPSMGELISMPSSVEEARSDFIWLTRTVVSNAESAARALAPESRQPPPPRPTRTPDGWVES